MTNTATSVAPRPHLRSLLQYELGPTLGTGMMGKVKRGVDTTTQTQVALKLMDWTDVHAVPKLLKNIAREIRAMRRVRHPNVLSLDNYYEQVLYTTADGETKPMILLVLELAAGGELMEFLMQTGALPEAVARTYFRQLVDGLAACHAQGVFHRDLKPENLLLDENFQLKIADFGLAALTEHADDKATLDLQTSCGTRPYMAPEVVQKRPYEGAPADVWSMGVVLFILLAGAPPFGVADESDWWFRACASRRYDLFWAAHEQTATFSPQAKDLLTRIFAVDPVDRLTLDEIKEHPWFNGETLPMEGVKAEMLQRKKMMKLSKQMTETQVRSMDESEIQRSTLQYLSTESSSEDLDLDVESNSTCCCQGKTLGKADSIAYATNVYAVGA